MDRQAQTMTLRDGRQLSFAEWGDFDGKPIFYFTSSEASRYSRHPDETILTDLGIHLYTFDRPGRGMSSPYKNFTLLSWAKDIREFIDTQTIHRVAIMGHSQGSVFALACANQFPEKISNITAVSNVAGFDDEHVKSSQSRFFSTQLFLARHAPWLMNLQWHIFRLTLSSKRGEKMILDGMRDLPETDQAALRIEGAKETNFQSLREAFRQGVTSITQDFRLTVNDWGFNVQDIQTKVFVWHGEADPMFSAAMSRYLEAQLPNCQTNFLLEGGSLVIYYHWREVMQQIVDHW